MSKKTFKQKVLKSIDKLPEDASLEEIMLAVYIIKNDEIGISLRKFDKSDEHEILLKG
jgi:hypothetical protein